MHDEQGKEAPCDNCYVGLDEENIEVWSIYSLVRSQVKVAPMGEIIGLDYAAVLGVIELYVAGNEIKRIFESVLMCFNIEQEAAGTIK